MSKTTVFQARMRDFDPTDGGGLNLDVKSGRIRDDNTITDKADQTVVLTDNATNFVEIDSVGAATANTSAFTSGSTPIAEVVTAGADITSITDKRAWISVGAGGSGAPTTPKYLVGDTADVAGLSAEILTVDVGNGTSLIKGGFFESWSAGSSAVPDPWTAVGSPTIARQSDITEGGLFTIKITATAANEGMSQTISGLKASTTYSVTVRVKVTSGDTAVIDTTGASSNLSLTSTSTTYETLTGTFTTDATPTDVILRLLGQSNTDEAFFGSVTFIEGTAPSATVNHPSDEHPRITNFQTTAPANTIDQGVWRIEIGEATLTPVIGTSQTSKAITFETAFRTARIILVTGQEDTFGGERGMPVGKDMTASGATIRHNTADGSNYTTTGAGTITWMAIGQV